MLLNCGVGEDSWVPWIAKRSNQSILKEISPECSLEGLMLKLQYLGHLMWRTNSLEMTLMLGKIEGGRRREQQRMRWLDDIADSMDMSLSSGSWWWTGKPGMVQSMGVVKSRTQLSNWTEPYILEKIFQKQPANHQHKDRSDLWVHLSLSDIWVQLSHKSTQTRRIVRKNKYSFKSLN